MLSHQDAKGSSDIEYIHMNMHIPILVAWSNPHTSSTKDLIVARVIDEQYMKR